MYLLKQNIHPKLALTLANLLLLAGVWLYNWEPISVFFIYILETILIGFINILKMILALATNPKYAIQPDKNVDTAGISGVGIIVFFAFHYYFFVIVQCVIFFSSVASTLPDFDAVSGLNGYLSVILTTVVALGIGGLFISHLFDSVVNFLLNGTFKYSKLSTLAAMPYGRILVQQFAIILGGFFFIVFEMLSAPELLSYLFVTTFIIIKIIVELKFPDLLSNGGFSFKSNSTD